MAVTAGMVLVAFVGFVSDVSATYPASGTLESVNLLAGEEVTLITSFAYDVTSLPAGTGLRVRFSQDGIAWYDAGGTAGAWETMTAGEQTINLSALAWSGDAFLYQMEFTSNGTGTPVLDDITVAWIFSPAPTITSPATGAATNDATPVLSGTGSAVGSVIRISSGAVLFSPTTTVGAAPDYGWSVTLDALAEGAYRLTATEDNGAISLPSNAVLMTIDTILPAAPGTPDLFGASDTGISATDGVTADTTPSFSVSCETDATVTLFSGSTVLGTGACASSTVTITSAELSTDGVYAVHARQRDAAGNNSTISSFLLFTLDTTSPSVSTHFPADDATDVAITLNLEIEFDESIGTTGTGYVTLYNASDNSIVERINTATGAVTGSGTATITIDPSVTLANSTTYYVTIDAFAFPDRAGNFLRALTGSTLWNFTTVAAPSPPSDAAPTAQQRGGRRGSEEGMAKRMEEILELILARFGDAKRESASIVAEEEEREVRLRDIAQQRREERLAARDAVPVAVRRPPLGPNMERIALRRNRLVAIVDASPVLYRDVPLDAWYSPFVSYVIEEEIAQGYRTEEGRPTGEFGVENPVTYAEVLKMLLEAVGSTDVPGKVTPRNVSARGGWASTYVARAEALQFSVMHPDLDVHTPAPRGAVIQLLLEAMAFPIPKTPSSFVDVSSTHPHSRAIGLAAYSGFIQGDTAPDGTPLNRFRPDEAINRAEVAKIIAMARELVR